MVVPGAFVDLGRATRTLATLADQSALNLRGGQLNNINRALAHERSALKSIIADARAHPEAFTGATDALGGARLLEDAMRQMTSAIDAGTAAVKAPGAKRRGIVLGAVPTADAATVGQRIREASDSVRDGFAALGGRRDLPAFEGGPGVDRSTLQMAAEHAPGIAAPGHKALQGAARGLLAAGLGRVLGIRHVHPSTVPTAGATIVAPNHVKFIDPAFALSLVDRPLRPMAKAGLFRHLLLGPILRTAGATPLEHGNAGESLAYARRILARDEALLMYPQGMLHHSNADGSHGRGVALLASEMGASVTPVGTWGAGPRKLRGLTMPDVRHPRHMVSVATGAPLTPPASPTPANQALFREQIAREQADLVAQAREHYRGRAERAEARAPLVHAATWIGVGGAAAGAWMLHDRD